MSRYVPAELRRKVAQRANFRCEYCRLPEIAAMVRFQVEHIISLKHGGKTTLENLAHACPICNSGKGTDLGTVLEDDDVVVRFFNPRKHNWLDHFEVKDGLILPKTPIGEATVKILDFNRIEHVLERLELIDAGAYP
jgi:hypothetical protein